MMADLARLSLEHQAMLRASGLSDEIIGERGYYTESDFKAVRDLGFTERQALVPSLVIPLYNVFGERAGVQIRPDVPRFNDDGKTVKYESPRGSKAMIDVPLRCQPALRDPSIPLHITEGAKKVDCLADRGACAISLNGVWNWRGTNASGGKTALADFEVIAFNGRLVRIVFDSDVTTKVEVARSLLRLKSFLERKGAKIEVIYLPSGGPGKVGVDDYLAAGGTIDGLSEFATTKVVVPVTSGLPQVMVSNRQNREITNECWAAIVADNQEHLRTFQTGGRLTRIDGSSGTPLIRTFSDPDIHLLLERLVDFRRETALGAELAASLPNDIGVELLNFWNKPVPSLKAIVTTPIVAADGRVSTKPGYDAGTELFYSPRGAAIREVPDAPTSDDVRQAKAIVEDWVCGFPFVTPASKANAIGLPLTYIAREMIDGPTPLFISGAPTPGTGKTLLVETAGIIMLGQVPEATTQPRDGDEWRKRITAFLLEGQTIVFIDNVKRKLESAELAAVLTATIWKDRRLGVNESITAANRAVWMATGNNIQLDLEIARRSVSCEIDARLERPWEGRQFKHKDLREWVRKQRGELIWAYLVLVRHWVTRGRPVPPVRLGMFEAWSEVVGGTLLAAGIDGFLENRTQLYLRADRESLEWHAFVEAWAEQFGESSVAAKDLIHLVRGGGHLTYLVERMRSEPSDHALRVSVGKALAERKDRRIGQWTVRWLGAEGHSKAQLYRLELAESDSPDWKDSADTPHGGERGSDSEAESAESAESDPRLRAQENAGHPDYAEATGIGTGKETPQTPHTPQSGSEEPDLDAESVAESPHQRSDTPRCAGCGAAMSPARISEFCRWCLKDSRQ